MSSSSMGDGSGGCSTAGNGGDDEKASSSGFMRVVWFRQMIHRWQSSSSGAATGQGDGERGNDQDASTYRTNNDAVGSVSERDPLVPASSANRPRPRLLAPRVLEERCPDEGGCGVVDSPVTPTTPDAPAGVPRGCCPVYVGLAERRRFVVPTAYLGMPVFRRLLEKAEEFEFHYGGGGVTIPCDAEAFKYILLVMERHRQGLVLCRCHASL